MLMRVRQAAESEMEPLAGVTSREERDLAFEGVRARPWTV